MKGRIEIDAEASDWGGGAGMWAAMPTAPERVSWLVETSRDASPVVRERVAFDARKRLPSNPDFWQVYARGT